MAGLPQVTDIQTSTLEGIILVSWKAPVRPVSGYMIDYTHNENQYYWKETEHTNTTLFGRLERHEVADGCQMERWMDGGLNALHGI